MRKTFAGVCGMALAALLIVGSPGVAHADAPDPAGGADGAEVGGLSDRLDVLAAAPGALDAGQQAVSEQLGLAGEGIGSLQVDEGRVAVSVFYATQPGASDFAALAELGEVVASSSEFRRAAAYVAPARLAEVAALPGVSSVTEALASGTTGSPSAVPGSANVSAGAAASALAPNTVPTASAGPACRTVEANALAPLRADLAEALHGIDGSGVTIGIISDSFSTSTDSPTTPEQDVAAGLLPGPGNPCGHETPVSVLAQRPGGSDEGRAMAQVVHSIAPGATLLVSTDGVDDLSFSQNITALAAAGATVIVDDIYSFTEPWFQQGAVGVAIDRVVAQGVSYVSSAGNYNNIGQEGFLSAGYSLNGWDTDAYRPTACPAPVLTALGDGVYDCMDFARPVSDGGSGVADPSAHLGLGATEEPVTWALQWAEPYNAAKGTFTLVATAPDGTVEVLDRGNAPMPITAGGYRPEVDGVYEFSIVRDLTAGPSAAITPALKWMWAFHSDIAVAEYFGTTAHDRVGASITGHTGLPSVISVAAVPAADTSTVEDFSSPGPVRLFFDYDPAVSPDPQPLPAPVTVAKPDVASVDGIHTNFFSPDRPVRDGVWAFFGTSAAAPSAAAVLALGRQYAPTATPDELRSALLGTARPVQSASPLISATDAAGSGLIDAAAFVAALPAPVPVPAPTPVPVPVPVPAADGSPRLAATGSAPLGVLAPWALVALLFGTAAVSIRRTRPRAPRTATRR
ncbi:S8 family serine peptidase [Herbiconiux sp. YIM B11900]|uniref:S8 family serine peptidase n=1 Tax=Herbiconiux sp. YIM B11900 TaxID=3404131 RepID=UPI003F825397